MLDAKIELLQQVDLFRGLAPIQIGAIAVVGRKVFFQAGENLITEGEAGDTAYIIMTGKASCTKFEAHQPVDQDLWPGTMVGELAMLVETIHNVTVSAKERLRAMAIHRDDFRAVMEVDPLIAKHISEKLLVRLHGLAADLRKIDHKLAEIESAA